MKKISLTFCLALLSSLFCPAQVSPLQFNKNGEFKIVQFTDIHFKYGNPASDIALKRIGEVLDAERPDLVVFTGDVVYAAPADTAMRKVLSYATDRKIPFVVTFGNHDNEQGKTRAELYDVIRSMPFNIQPDRGGVESPDYVLTLKSSDGMPLFFTSVTAIWTISRTFTPFFSINEIVLLSVSNVTAVTTIWTYGFFLRILLKMYSNSPPLPPINTLSGTGRLSITAAALPCIISILLSPNFSAFLAIRLQPSSVLSTAYTVP